MCVPPSTFVHIYTYIHTLTITLCVLLECTCACIHGGWSQSGYTAINTYLHAYNYNFIIMRKISTSYHMATRALAKFITRGREAPEGDKLAKRPRGHVITGLLRFKIFL